jgi:hypothetical protein
VEFVVQQVWKGRCAISNKRFGGHILPTLTRWDGAQPCSPHNLVLMLQSEAEKLAEKGHEAFSAQTREFIEKRLAWAKQVCLSEDLSTACINTGATTSSTARRKRGANGGNRQTWIETALKIGGGVCLGAAIALIVTQKK